MASQESKERKIKKKMKTKKERKKNKKIKQKTLVNVQTFFNVLYILPSISKKMKDLKRRVFEIIHFQEFDQNSRDFVIACFFFNLFETQ